MIRPDMATLLCFAVSDVSLSAKAMPAMLKTAAERSFNRITVDGDTSTNDTLLFMANGVSGAVAETPRQLESVQQVLDRVLLQLARMCIKDGEGATKLVDIVVRNARNEGDAVKVADAVANSNLVKTALFGEDANWGRILAAAGRCGAQFDPERIDVYFDEVKMVENGQGLGKAVESEATAVLKKPEFAVIIDLKAGTGQGTAITCDLSVEYVRINADYRS
jgi:glutamate N-acetyltransferase/amino-acid N-acetyltransferase